MHITYLYNSGFLVSEGKRLLIFDYIPFPGVQVEEFVNRAENVYVFVSHRHADHYSRDIWEWKERHGKMIYLLSDDVKGEGIPFGKGTTWEDANLWVRAHGSTDEGVSFEVKIDGKTLFHAGDLNCWHWVQENSPQEEHEARKWFSRELEEIAESIPEIDVAFFPVDARMKGDYDDGAREFITRIRPKLFIPMHFRDQIDAPKQFANKNFPGTRVAALTEPMAQIEY